MHITAYVQPQRTYLPCTGVGRHINNMLLHLANRQELELSLLVSQEYLCIDGKLNPRTPLRKFTLRTYPYRRLLVERFWKFFDYPKMDRFIGVTDFLYSPVAEYVPTKKDIPKIITMHDMHTLEPNLPWSKDRKHIWQRLKSQVWISRVFNQVDHICTVSNFSKQRIIDLLDIDSQKITVIGNGVDESFYEIANVDLNLIESFVEEPYAIVVGGLKYKKGGYYVLEVARELKRRRSSLKILIVGSNEKDLLEAANTLDNIIVKGLVPEDELPKLVRRASSLLFLSLYEGFGIPALEAMAAGVPTVVADRAALREVGGKAAIIVEPKNLGQVADVLISLEKNSQLRNYHIQLGRSHAQSFTWECCVERLINVLHKHS